MADFKQAVKWMKEGKKVRRKTWIHPGYLYSNGIHIFHENGNELRCFIEFLEATDFEIYNENNFGDFIVREDLAILSRYRNSEVICRNNELDDLEKAVKRARELNG